jgi:hypothetical protein
MIALNSTLKSLACGVGALAITAVLSWTFVQSTATASDPDATEVSAHAAKLTAPARHLSFGQSEPAVLVD